MSKHLSIGFSLSEAYEAENKQPEAQTNRFKVMVTFKQEGEEGVEMGGHFRNTETAYGAIEAFRASLQNLEIVEYLKGKSLEGKLFYKPILV